MPISRDEVIRAYRVVLRREPESEAVIEGSLTHASIESLSAQMLASDEMAKILNPGTALAPNPQHARHVIVKELGLAPGDQAAVLVAHAPAGRLKPHVLPYLNLLHESGLKVLLVVVVDRPLELRDEEVAAAQGVIVRDNAGYDFGAWGHALTLQPDLFGASLLILTNDSIVPTANRAVFGTMIDRVRDSAADIVGLTSSHEYGWHVQSYFLGLKARALSSSTFQHFVRDIQALGNKDEVIRTYEVPFAALMQRAGLVIEAIFTSSMPANPTFFSWRALIEAGFPFIKLLMLRKQFAATADWPDVVQDLNDNWPDVLRTAGFDIDLVRASIHAADIAAVPSGQDTALLVHGHRLAAAVAARSPRVAYFGPWNYDGIGEASRALLCALRYTSFQLNAYPVVKPFATYRPICPSVETVDFGARPDVAIVHLNPDFWHLLTGEQLEIIHSAKWRVGYWDCQTDNLAPSWDQYVQSIDCIWTPTRQHADAITAQVRVPVAVVPLPGREPKLNHFANVDFGQAAIDNTANAGIAYVLSYQQVAKVIERSIAALSADGDTTRFAVAPRTPVSVPPPLQLSIDFSASQRFAELVPKVGIVPVPLAADLSWGGESLPDGELADWLVFAPGNARVCPEAFDILLNAASHRPDVILFYADDVAAEGEMLDRIRLKPEFDRTLFVAQDYIGAPVIVRRKSLLAIGGLDPTQGSAMIYALVLRIADAGGTIARIPHVLIGHESERPVASLAERRLALRASAACHDIDLIAATMPSRLLQRRHFRDEACPAVTIVIPTCRSIRAASNQAYIERLLNGIADVQWPMDRLTVIVGDDIAEQPGWAVQPWPFKFRWLATPRADGEPFNYAAKMNLLWRTAEDEQIVLMNDDVLPHGQDWLKALAGFASDDGVGGVGPCLYYDDGSIQHVGMIPFARGVAHAWLGWPADTKTYQDWGTTQREWSMLTGAVFATRRSVLERVNGFDERFSLEFNDVDLCLRLRNLGYRLVFNPDAEFTHVEKASRGNALVPGQDLALFLSRWSPWLDNDPAFHPSFDRNRLDLSPVVTSGAWYMQNPR